MFFIISYKYKYLPYQTQYTIPSTETALIFLSIHEGRTDTLLPPQISRPTLHYNHGPVAEDLLVPQEWVPHRCAGQLCSRPLAITVTAITVSVHVWANTSQNSFWLLVAVVLLGRPWWSLKTLFQIGKMAMGNVDLTAHHVCPTLP